MMINQIEKSDENTKLFKEYVSNLDLLSSEYMSLSGTVLAPMETRSSIVSVLKTVGHQNTLENIVRTDLFTGLKSEEYLYGEGRKLIDRYTYKNLEDFSKFEKESKNVNNMRQSNWKKTSIYKTKFNLDNK